MGARTDNPYDIINAPKEGDEYLLDDFIVPDDIQKQEWDQGDDDEESAKSTEDEGGNGEDQDNEGEESSDVDDEEDDEEAIQRRREEVRSPSLFSLFSFGYDSRHHCRSKIAPQLRKLERPGSWRG